MEYLPLAFMACVAVGFAIGWVVRGRSDARVIRYWRESAIMWRAEGE